MERHQKNFVDERLDPGSGKEPRRVLEQKQCVAFLMMVPHGLAIRWRSGP